MRITFEEFDPPFYNWAGHPPWEYIHPGLEIPFPVLLTIEAQERVSLDSGAFP